jgi:hypothetical protein
MLKKNLQMYVHRKRQVAAPQKRRQPQAERHWLADKRELKNFTTNDRIKQDVFFMNLNLRLLKKTGGLGGDWEWESHVCRDVFKTLWGLWNSMQSNWTKSWSLGIYRYKYGVCIKNGFKKWAMWREKRCLLFLDFFASDQLLSSGATYHGNIVNFGNTPHKNVDCDNSWAIWTKNETIKKLGDCWEKEPKDRRFEGCQRGRVVDSRPWYYL